ncbi:putative U3 small nucleolar RNA-associated protein 11 [Porphyridium purpureum]|uniref:U3 small nucleolar RNA-associated protein 11 n=1 Tax=Porphyridium purpureum TaxID=35688 RepID=A0A5J4Z8K8_PORPP|nr:putative U3 small nucleolar RNA-associated protein 11 [Porphyridium purpureum]|eukprot:POR0282..scf295_1
MSSWKKVEPRRMHKERAQPERRQRLGLLEKKKDYKLRARDFHKKEDELKRLREKAALRNPDEFYHGMISAGTRTARRRDVADAIPARTQEEHALVLHHDANYVSMKRSVEAAKIDRLKSQMHFTALAQVSGGPRRTIFVSDDDERSDIAAGASHDAKRLPGELQTKDRSPAKPVDPAFEAQRLSEQTKVYKELAGRVEREEKLHRLLLTMETERNLMSKGKRQRVKDRDEYTGEPAVYKWRQKRKR